MQKLKYYFGKLKNSAKIFLNKRSLGLNIHRSSSINMMRLQLKKNCVINIDEQSQVEGAISFDKENASISIGKRVFMNGHGYDCKVYNDNDDYL